MPKLIVGIDPGERTGIAAVDIKTGGIILNMEKCAAYVPNSCAFLI